MKNSLIKKLLFSMFLGILCLSFFRADAQAKAIYTGNTKIDCAAEAIINRVSKPGMTNRQKLKACYDYLVKNMRYSHSDGKVKIKPSKKETEAYKAVLAALKEKGEVTYSRKFKGDWRNLLTMRGTCKDMSGVMCILANHLGFHAGYKTGRYVRSNGSSVEHWWNWIKVEGKKLYCDVQAANDGGHSQKRINKYYLKSAGSQGWRRHHRG